MGYAGMGRRHRAGCRYFIFQSAKFFLFPVIKIWIYYLIFLIEGNPFSFQQEVFHFQTTLVTAKGAVRTDDSMTGANYLPWPPAAPLGSA